MESVEKLLLKIEELKKENEKYKKLAFYDALTGCYNRTWFYQFVKNEDEFYITQADVNYLRTINFVLGHAEGDMLIKECVEIFKKYGDVVRMGGDEFVIITKDKNKFEELNTLSGNKFSLGGCFKPKTMRIGKAMSISDAKLFENKKYVKNGGYVE